MKIEVPLRNKMLNEFGISRVRALKGVPYSTINKLS